MRSAQRPCAVAPTLLAVCLTCLSGAAADGIEPAEHSDGTRCRTDALEQWYCAADPRGSAVVDPLGRVVCAPGACVKQDTEDGEEWLCATAPGGRAAAAPEGPRCDGECRPPEATACKKL